jgi:DNA-binding NarL/FixJ family response regulator
VRVVIVDPDLKAGRRLAAAVEEMTPAADVLLYRAGDEAIAGIVAHSPDVTFVAPTLGAVDGPTFLEQAVAVTQDPRYVGLVDTPDADASVRWIDAGATLVVARPVDRLGLRTALGHVAGGVDT